jgi:hypothetical protein
MNPYLWLLVPMFFHVFVLNQKPQFRSLMPFSGFFTCLIVVSFALELSHRWLLLLATGLLVLALAIGWASATEKNFSHRLTLVWSSLSLMISALVLLAHTPRGELLIMAFSITHLVYLVSQYLIFEIESLLGDLGQEGSIYGIAHYLPRSSGLLLIGVMLMSCSPGSILFMIEDLLLHFALEESLVCLGLTLLITLVCGVSLYSGYMWMFSGYNTALHQETVFRPKEPTYLGLKLSLLFAIVVGIMPGFF